MADTKGGRRVIAEMIKGIRIATLTTRDASGTLRSRPMATQDMDFEGKLWFLTYNDSPKTEDIGKGSQVNVSYSDSEKHRYVSLSGTARVSQEKRLIRDLWHPALKAWFPQGQDDPRIAVIEVDAEEAEYWDSPSSAFVKIAGLAKSLATNEPYLPGENKKIDFETGEVKDMKPAMKEKAKDPAA